MGAFAVHLSETAPTWGRRLAPIAQRVAALLRSTVGPLTRTPLPGSTRHHVERIVDAETCVKTPTPPSVCPSCGTSIRSWQTECATCAARSSTDRLVAVAKHGRELAHTADAEARRSAARRRYHAAERQWSPTEQPAWLTEETFLTQIRPMLSTRSASDVSRALGGVSRPYAANVRNGRRCPHPRHWLALARLVGFEPSTAINSVVRQP